MASLVEVIGSRRRLAAQAAADTAQQLDSGEQRSTDVQVKLEEALGDLTHYSAMYDALAPLAGDLGEYRRGGRSLIGDLWKARHGDRGAADRIVAQARADQAGDIEQRDIGGSSTWASLPKWLVDDAAPLSTIVAPMVKMLAKPLPDGARGTVNLVRFTTAPVASPQSGFNGALPTPSIAEGTSGPTVKTFGIRVALANQLLEQGRQGIDAQLVPAMIAAVDAAIEDSILNADGTAGSVVGIRSTAGVSTGTYTDATPTAAEAWPIVEGVIRACEIGLGGSPILVMHPRRLSWLRQRAVVEPVAGFNFDTPTLPGATVRVLGSVNIVADAAVPTNLGAGTEDVIIVLRSTDVLDLFVGPPRVQIGDLASSTAESYINVWKNVAFTAARLPAAVGVVGGTGLAAPSP